MTTATTKTEYLALLARLFPREWIEPKLATGQGYELLRAFAAVGERVSQAIQRHKDGKFLLDATGPTFSTGMVEFYRPSPDPTAPALIMRAGTIVRASSTGREYVTTDDSEFAVGGDIAGDGSGVAARARVASAEYDAVVPFTTAGGESIAGVIDTIQRPYQTLTTDRVITFLDDSVLVRQVSAFTGGVAGTLDQLGTDLGLPRHSGEADDTYRERIRQLPDTITPDALQRVLTAALAPFGATASIIELFGRGCFYNAPNTTVGSFSPRNSFYNRSTVGDLQPVYLSNSSYRGAIAVVLPNLASMRDRGLYYHHSGTAAADFETPLGQRAWPFYNQLARGDTTTRLQGFYSSRAHVSDYKRASTMTGIKALLEVVKAAGVLVKVFVRNDVPA